MAACAAALTTGVSTPALAAAGDAPTAERARPVSAASVTTQAAPARTYSCNVRLNGNTYQAGYYDGDTVVPSTWGVSAAGVEAQCILAHRGFNPGTIDGVFGPNSRAAMMRFQRFANEFGAGLDVDGLPGPHSWPWLRVCCY